MPRGKPRYNKPPSFVDLVKSGKLPEPPLLGESFKSELRTAIGRKQPRGRKSKSNTQETENFIEVLMQSADWALGHTTALRLETTKAERLAECDDLIGTLRETMGKLRSISPDLDTLLGVDFDPLAAADDVEKLVSRLVRVSMRIEAFKAHHFVKGRKQKTNRQSILKTIATELAHRVTSDASSFGVKPTASTVSFVVTILEVIGDNVGLAYSASTWRDILNCANRT